MNIHVGMGLSLIREMRLKLKYMTDGVGGGLMDLPKIKKQMGSELIWTNLKCELDIWECIDLKIKQTLKLGSGIIIRYMYILDEFNSKANPAT